MALIRPRLNDFHRLAFTQQEVDFAIPFLDEDIPLYLDPFLLWKSPSQQDNALHTEIIRSVNGIGKKYTSGDKATAVDRLIKLSECNEIGFGDSAKRIGKPIGKKTAEGILSLFIDVPQIVQHGIVHIESIQLLVDQISKDRISDISSNIVKSFLMDYTIDQCKQLNIPMKKVPIPIFDTKTLDIKEEKVALPFNPTNSAPILLVPKRWLRFLPWINYDDFFDNHFVKLLDPKRFKDRIEILKYNRKNYDLVGQYISLKERTYKDCKNDPLFKAIPVGSAKRKMATITALPTGKTNAADRAYEDNASQLITSLLYPELDFADTQSRTESSVLIRDLIFYSNRTHTFTRDMYEKYDCRQMVFELKNVKELKSDHVDQLRRYLKDEFGRFGVLVTRNAPPKKVIRNTIDLWSGQRVCIIILDDKDLAQMCRVYEHKQRRPLDVLNKKHVEFSRLCPS